MAPAATEIREWKRPGPLATEAEMLGECSARDLGRRGMPSPRLAIER
jgi:hypothetical protein